MSVVFWISQVSIPNSIEIDLGKSVKNQNQNKEEEFEK